VGDAAACVWRGGVDLHTHYASGLEYTVFEIQVYFWAAGVRAARRECGLGGTAAARGNAMLAKQAGNKTKQQ
jgi:hypothetical protein